MIQGGADIFFFFSLPPFFTASLAKCSLYFFKKKLYYSSNSGQGHFKNVNRSDISIFFTRQQMR